MVHRGFALPAVLTLLAALSPLSAHAVLIEIDSEQWDVEAIGTSAFLDEGVEDLLKAQPWWGDSALAYAFADAVRGQLGIGLYVFSDDPTWRGADVRLRNVPSAEHLLDYRGLEPILQRSA